MLPKQLEPVLHGLFDQLLSLITMQIKVVKKVKNQSFKVNHVKASYDNKNVKQVC